MGLEPLSLTCSYTPFDFPFLGIGLDVSAFSKKADEVFIGWLKSSRESGSTITLAKVKDKVAELFQTFGVSNIEKNCKWFLLWNNR